VNCSPAPAHSVLGEGTAWREHFVKRSDAVAGAELVDLGADAVDYARDVVAGIGVVVFDYVGDFPVFGVGAADNDADDELLGFGGWDG
jgi:hypothetical protein